MDTLLFLKQFSQDEQKHNETHTLIPLTHQQCGNFLSLKIQIADKKKKITNDFKILLRL